MRTKLQLLALTLFFFSSCDTYEDSPERKQWLAEIKAVEEEFNKMAHDSGLSKAFGHFATKNAVLQREGRLIKGRDSIMAYYERTASPTIELSWVPSYIDVSDDGTLGYTYGKFKYTVIDSGGAKNNQSGVFHTVWRKQYDGSWKYVWD